MPLPKNPQAYNDVKTVLDAAVSAGGGTYTLSTANAAVRWRQRANTLRKLLWDRGETTLWDDYEFVLRGCTVVIRFRDVAGTLTDNESNPIEATPEEDEAILGEVEELKRKLRLESE